MKIKVAAAIVLGALCGATAFAAAPGSPKHDQTVSKPKPADKKTLKKIKSFLDTPTAELDPDDVPFFMGVPPESLPKDLRPRYIARKEELLALRHIAEGRKKPPLRRLGEPELPPSSCAGPAKMENPGMMAGFGFMEITDYEEIRLMQDTQCNECELMTEFTLTLVEEDKPAKKRDKKNPPKVHYFLHQNDPLTALVGLYRTNPSRKPFGTNFFGLSHPSCR